ncbi:MAG: sulfurtransferase TusA family protein [Rhizobiales bacterium]|nr:sulfurtransferase TusA family protein [Hyphomicrobiales bacterium]
MTKRDSEEELDVSGLLCPLPVLKARKRLLSMPQGQVLKVIASDPMSAIDMPHFCVEAGHELVSHEQDGGIFIFRIRSG